MHLHQRLAFAAPAVVVERAQRRAGATAGGRRVASVTERGEAAAAWAVVTVRVRMAIARAAAGWAAVVQVADWVEVAREMDAAAAVA